MPDGAAGASPRPDGAAGASPRPDGAAGASPRPAGAAGASSIPEETAGGPAAHVTIACTLRSGSNLLCDMLHRNGFGHPKEWFQDRPRAGQGGHHAGSDAELFERQMAAFHAAHGAGRWRGLKFDWQQFRRLRRLAADLPCAARMLRAADAGQWLFLRRRDLAAQAVSLYAAQLTGAWMGEGSAEYDRLPQDFDAIYERFAALAADAFAWEAFFRAGELAPVNLYYEDLVAGDAAAWLTVLRHLAPRFDPARLDLTALQAPPRFQRPLHDLKSWFHDQILAGRLPRSPVAVLEEIAATVAQVTRMPMTQSTVERFMADRIAAPGGFRLRKLDLGRDLACEGPAGLIAQHHFLDQVALRLDPGASCSFALPGERVMLQFYTHAWSGIAEIALDGRVERIDLFSERPDTRHFIRDLPPGFAGSIAVRSSGARNLLSEGAEVWLQRVFVLADGSL